MSSTYLCSMNWVERTPMETSHSLSRVLNPLRRPCIQLYFSCAFSGLKLLLKNSTNQAPSCSSTELCLIVNVHSVTLLLEHTPFHHFSLLILRAFSQPCFVSPPVSPPWKTNGLEEELHNTSMKNYKHAFTSGFTCDTHAQQDCQTLFSCCLSPLSGKDV